MDAHGNTTLGICLALALCLAACGGDAGDGGGGERAAAPASEPAGEQETAGGSGYTVVSVEDAGTIHGVVLFAGTVPAARTVEVTEDANACGESVRIQTLEVTFGVAEKVKVKCDIHEWMSAWVVVADHPYNAVTRADGSFALENVPPGSYTLEVWHEDLGSTTQTVTVATGEDTEVSFELTSAGQAH